MEAPLAPQNQINDATVPCKAALTSFRHSNPCAMVPVSLYQCSRTDIGCALERHSIDGDVSPLIVGSNPQRGRLLRPVGSDPTRRRSQNGNDAFKSPADDSEWEDESEKSDSVVTTPFNSRPVSMQLQAVEIPRKSSPSSCIFISQDPIRRPPSTWLRSIGFSHGQRGGSGVSTSIGGREHGLFKSVASTASLAAGNKDTLADGFMRLEEDVEDGSAISSGSFQADSVLDAHVVTMRALEALSSTASLSYLRRARSWSYGDVMESRLGPYVSKLRAARLGSLPSLDGMSDQSSIQPSYLTQGHTPHIADVKESPQGPALQKQQQGRKDEANQLLYHGILHTNDLPRSVHHECRGFQTRDLISPCHAVMAPKAETTIWVSSKPDGRNDSYSCSRLEKVEIPTGQTFDCCETNHNSKEPSTWLPWNAARGYKPGPVRIDDMYLAECLQHAYRQLAGHWSRRLFDPRRLQCIRLAPVPLWSGTTELRRNEKSVYGILLGSSTGTGRKSETCTTFTEAKLMALFRTPEMGSARYSWVDWARRVSKINEKMCDDRHALVRAASASNNAFHDPAAAAACMKSRPKPTSYCLRCCPCQGELLTLQFVHGWSASKISSALAMMLALCLLALLLWVFLGPSTASTAAVNDGRSERLVGSLLIAGLVLALEGVAFTVWLLRSWSHA